LGYDEYMKNRSGQAVGLFVKAQSDTLLREYALYWTAQAQRALGRNADAYKVLQTLLHDYPTTAIREQVLEAFGPTAVQLGHPQDIEVDAERLYALSQAYRTAKKEAEMFNALNTLAQSYPVSKWNEDGLMAAGNYHWVELEREKAAEAYQRVLDSFPNGKYA